MPRDPNEFLEVSLFPTATEVDGSDEGALDAIEAGDHSPAVVYTAEYVSLINDSTFGVPPLVAPKDGNPPLAALHDRVLFINTSRVAAFLIERKKG
jgi:hypothetical protein